MATRFRCARRLVPIALLATVALSTLWPATAQEPVFAPGEPIVTGFSGALPPTAPPPGSDPLDYTLIDPDGQSMLIQHLLPDGPPAGQAIDATADLVVTAADVGQVFGVTLDNAPELEEARAPNIYLAATSAYGLNLTAPDADGNPKRSKVGDPAASFMAGQWGSAGGAVGYPGSIWKVDGTTGEVSLFTTITNSGASLGDIKYDAASAQFFVSDRDTGLIYRLAHDGVILDTFDHGVDGRPAHELAPVADDGSAMSVTDPALSSEDPSTWGFTQIERKTFGLAAWNGRLYYAVAEGPQIWSVRINADGSFGAARWELDVTGLTSANEIAGILFDPQGRMILAQRGAQVGSYDYSVFAEAGTSSVVRYEREFPDNPATPGTWVPEADVYTIGMSTDGANASGGIALGPDYDSETGSFSGPNSTILWSTGDSLRVNPDLDPPLEAPFEVHGLQGNDRSLVEPQNMPPLLSYFVDRDGNTDDTEASKQGHVGAVAIWQAAGDSAQASVVPPVYFPPGGYEPPVYDAPEDEFNLTLEKWAKPYFCLEGAANWFCSYTIRVENTGTVPYWGPVVVDDHLPNNNPGATMHFWPQPPWSCGPTGPTAYQCATGPVLLYPGDGVVLHEIVKLPKAMVDYCQLPNVASINWFWGGDENPADDFGVGIAGIKASGCVPPGGTDLTLKKISAPNCIDGGAAWNCSYAVIVQNAGPGNFSGPIQVQDTLGINAPATTFGPWTCAQAGPVLTCDINVPPVNAAPGWTSGFIVTAHVPKNVGPPLCDLDNKANISAPAAGSPMNMIAGNDFDEVTGHIPDPACLVAAPVTDLEMQKSGLGCVAHVYLGTPGYACKWQMTLTNIGAAPYNGPLSFIDTTAGATANTLNSLPVCAGAPHSVTCTVPAIGLAPGAPVNLPFFTFYPGGAAVCSVTNNLSILDPNPGLPQNPAGNDSDTVGQALPNPACAAPGVPHLNIQKTALGCASDPGSPDWLCEFEIKVINYGTGPQPGPIHVRDFNDKPTTFTGAACAPSGVNQWLCVRPAPLPAFSDWTFQATTRVNPNSVSLADCNVKNTVVITNPLAVDPGHISQASQKVPQLFINVGPGPVAVYCDPPSLALTKTHIKTVASGDGYDSTFTVRATSTGPDPYIGTVEVEELLPEGTSFVSASNWSCVPTTGNDVHCSSPFKTIPVGKYTQMTITMHIPADVAKKANCDVVNTVTAAISAEVLHSDEGVQYTASAAAQLPASACGREEPKDPAPQCRVNQLMPDGQCCPAGTQWNGKQCAKPRPTDVPKEPTPEEPAKDPTPQCPRDSHINNAGKCVCDRGTEGRPGKCQPIVEQEPEAPSCPADSRLRRGECQCLPGTEGRPGRCQPIVQEEPEAPSCPADSRLRRGECRCLPGTEGRPGNCQPVFEQVEPELPQCPPDSRLRRGQCVCLQGTQGEPGNCQSVDVVRPGRGEGRPGRGEQIEDLPTLQLDRGPVIRFPRIN